MALQVGELFALITADDGPFRSTLNSAGSALKEAGKSMRDVGAGITAGVTLPIAGAIAASVKLASDMEENVNKVNVAFKDNATEIQDWSKGTLKSFGIAQLTALEMASLFGDMGTAMGQSTGEASKMSSSLVGLAGDLASFKNIGIEQAQDALKGIFTGEGESLKSLGVIMQDSTLEAYALASGQQKAYKEMTQAEKVALRYAFVMNATKNAQGDFARTSGGAANQMRIFQESLKEIGVSFGNILLPAFTEIITYVNGLIQKFGGLGLETQKMILIVAGVAAAIGPLLIVFGMMISAVGTIMTAVSGMAGALAFLTGPIGLVILALVGLTAGIVYLYNTNEEFRNQVTQVWTTIQDVLLAVLDTIKIGLETAWNSMRDSVFAVLENMKIMVTEAFSFIFLVINDVLNSVFTFMENWGTDILLGITTALTKVWEWIAYVFNDLIKPLWTEALAVLTKLWNEHLKETVDEILAFVGRIATIALDVYNKFVAPIVGFLLKTLVPVFREAFKVVLNVLGTFFGGLGDIVKNVFKVLNGLLDFITGIFTGNWGKAWEGVKTMFSGIMGSLYSVVKLPLNMIISGINTMIRGLNGVKVPDWVPGMGGKGINIPQIPMLAKGGIVDSPTLAMIGEGTDSEVVAPLGKLRGMIQDAIQSTTSQVSFAGVFDGAVIQVRSDSDIKSIARELYNMQVTNNRGRGLRF
jgi:phage-related protein